MRWRRRRSPRDEKNAEAAKFAALPLAERLAIEREKGDWTPGDHRRSSILRASPKMFG
jgi:hypothetical protein